jgi:hypothetical protein
MNADSTSKASIIDPNGFLFTFLSPWAYNEGVNPDRWGLSDAEKPSAQGLEVLGGNVKCVGSTPYLGEVLRVNTECVSGTPKPDE